MPADVVVDAAALQSATEHLSRDACITYVANGGEYKIGLESASGQFVGQEKPMPDTGATMSCLDEDEALGLGLTIKPLQGVQLRAVSQPNARFEGVVSTRVVYLPGTRHELVVPAYMLVIKGLKDLATMLLGRVEQHRIRAVIDTVQQQMRFMPKLHLGRAYHASIPLQCHVPSELQQELQQLAKSATAAVSAAIPVPRGPLVAALVVPEQRYHVANLYIDDVLVWDAAERRFIAANIDFRRIGNDTRAAVGVLLRHYMRQQQEAALLPAPPGPRRLSPAEMQQYNAAVEQLLRSGDIELNPGPDLFWSEFSFGGVFYIGLLPPMQPDAVQIVVCCNVQYYLSLLLACWHTAAAVVRMLLARSGDVEPNPGPPVRDALAVAMQRWRGFSERVAGTFRAQCMHRAGGDRVGRASHTQPHTHGSSNGTTTQHTSRATAESVGPIRQC